MSDNQQREVKRLALLQQVVQWMELPMVVLGFFWLGLLIIDFVYGFIPILQILATAIWVIFIAEFVLELAIAPRKLVFLKQNWLLSLALLVPALRVIRFLQVLRVLQGARVVRVLGSISRASRALTASLGRHGFRYVVAVTIIMTLAGAAGMYAFERPGLRTYPDALWWTAMIMVTLGSGYWPHSVEGRILCFILSLYAFSVFGYVTAALATFLVGREAKHDRGEIAGQQSINELKEEIQGLRKDVQEMKERIP